MMLSKGANNYNKGLKGACKGGHLEIVKMMLDFGANYYNYGLCYACRGGHIEIVKMMIELGANIYDSLKHGNLELQILYRRLSGKNITLPIKTDHPEYHLLNIYSKKIPDINRIINKYIY